MPKILNIDLTFGELIKFTSVYHLKSLKNMKYLFT